ncbi:MAG: anti-sigma factor family protein [Syntrophomonadaceae bacterium]|jgi:hypothetical protein
MNCQHVDRYLYDFCDNRLSPTIHNEIESHLRKCEQCRLKAELTQLENEVLSDKSYIPALTDNFTDKVMENLSMKMACGTAVDNRKKIFSLFKTGDLVWTAALMAIVLLMIVIAPQVIPDKTQFQVADQPQTVIENNLSSDLKTSRLADQTEITGTEKDEVEYRKDTFQSRESDNANLEYSASNHFGNSTNKLNTPAGKTSEEKQQVAMVLNEPVPIAENGVRDNHIESAIPSRKSASSVSAPTSISPANAEFPYPVNIPAAYNFSTADKIDNRTVQYSFYDYGQKELSVIIANIQSNNDDLNNSAMISDQLSRNEVSVSPETNPGEIFFEINGVSYAATLSGNISSDEVKDLRKTLKFAIDASVTAP